MRFASFCFQYDNIYYAKYIRGEWWGGGRNSDKQDFIIMSGGKLDSSSQPSQCHLLRSIVRVRGGRTVQDRHLPPPAKPEASGHHQVSTFDKVGPPQEMNLKLSLGKTFEFLD